MRLTDRLSAYLVYKGITVYLFEKTCELGNGYIGKQMKGKGAIGSDILERIAAHYPDLNMNWLITGKGKMLQRPLTPGKGEEELYLMEEAPVYKIRNKLVGILQEQIRMLETSLPGGKRKKTRK